MGGNPASRRKQKRGRRSEDEIIAALEEQIAQLREKARADSRFSAAKIRAERKRLRLSAADYGALIGVSQLTVYNWEKGRSRPQPAQLRKWLAVKGISRPLAWKKLGY